MAVHSIGIRYHGPLPDSSQAVKVPGSWHQLFHKVSGGRNPSHYHEKEHSEFYLEKHYLQVRDTQSARLRQRKAVRQQCIQGFFLRA